MSATTTTTTTRDRGDCYSPIEWAQLQLQLQLGLHVLYFLLYHGRPTPYQTTTRINIDLLEYRSKYLLAHKNGQIKTIMARELECNVCNFVACILRIMHRLPTAHYGRGKGERRCLCRVTGNSVCDPIWLAGSRSGGDASSTNCYTALPLPLRRHHY